MLAVTDQKRNRDVGKPGHPTQFASHLNSRPEDELAPPQVKLSEPQQKLLDRDLALAEISDRGILVSGREYQSALALERKGLGHVRHQGPNAGWFTAAPRDAVGRIEGRELQSHGKQVAAQFLAAQGHRVLDIDVGGTHHLITDEDGVLVFTIVKTRAGTTYGHPLGAVTRNLVEAARAAAQSWARLNRRTGGTRVDAIGVVAPRDGSTPHIEHLHNIG